MKRGFLWIFLALNALLLLWLYRVGHPILTVGAPLRARPELPVYGRLGSFQLVREDARAFGEAQMSGRIWVADFIFTRCPNQCPLMSEKFSLMQRTLPQDVGLVSFTVDPGHDDAKTLQAYAHSHHADETRWVFLTGAESIIRGIMNDLHLGKPDDPNMHSLRFVLLDKALRVRGYYDSTEGASAEKINNDIRLLQKES